MFYISGTALTVLNVVGNDSEITLSATSSWDSHLSFDPVSRNLTLVQPLDHEKSQQIEVKLSCFIKENTFKVSFYLLLFCPVLKLVALHLDD